MYVGPDIVQDGLVFAMDPGSERSYPGSGTTTTNIINGANGTLTNGVAYVSNNGGAFDFDGTDDFILFPDDTNLNLQTLTMESWVKLDTTLYQQAFIFEKGSVNTQYSNFQENNGNFYFRTMTLSIPDLALNLTNHVSAGDWFHIVCTYGSGVKRIYINGVAITTQTGLTGTIPTNTNGPRIGAHSSGYYLDGEIAVSRVYNKALTAAEVLQNYNAQKSRFGL